MRDRGLGGPAQPREEARGELPADGAALLVGGRAQQAIVERVPHGDARVGGHQAADRAVDETRDAAHARREDLAALDEALL